MHIRKHGIVSARALHDRNMLASDAWKNTAGGDWSATANWSASQVPGAVTAATIATAGTYTVSITTADIAGSLTVNNKNATVSDNGGGTLTLSGALAITAGTFLMNGGTLAGATISTGTNGTFTTSNQGGTLSAVTYQGTLNLSTNSSSLLYITNGLTLTGTGGTGAGTVNIGYGAALFYTGTGTLANATINLNNTYASLLGYDPGSTGATLTLGSTLNLLMSANADGVRDGTVASDALLNLGTITASGVADYIGYSANYGGIGNAVTNGGQILVTGGYSYLNSNNFTNTGTVTVSNGATLTIEPSSFANAGAITANGGTIVFDNSITTAQLNAINYTAGTVDIGSSGTLTNSGTLQIPATGTLALTGGTINGATINDPNGAFSAQSGTLSGVTYLGTLSIGGAAGDIVSISNGIALAGTGGTGAGTVNVNYYSALYYSGTGTLSNATITLDNTYSSLIENDPGSSGYSLTLGTSLTLLMSGTDNQLRDGGAANDALINLGTINASGAAEYIGSTPSWIGGTGNNLTNQGNLLVTGGYSYLTSTSVTNTGTITVSNGATLTIEPSSFTNSGSITANNGTIVFDTSLTTAQLNAINYTAGTIDIAGTLTNSGTLQIPATGTLALTGGTIIGATINDPNGALSAITGTLSGVTYQGTLNIGGTAGNTVLISNGITLQGTGGTGAGTVNVNYYEAMYYSGTGTLSNATITLDNTYASLIGSDPASAGYTITLAASLNLLMTGNDTQLRDGGAANDALINLGTINASGAADDIGSAPNWIGGTGNSFTNAGSLLITGGYSYILGNSFTNTGLIDVSNGGSLIIAPTASTNFKTAGTISGGSYEVDAASTLTVYCPNLTTLVASVTLNGTASVLQAYNTTTGTYTALDASLTTVNAGGTLTIEGGRTLTGSNILTDNSSILLSAGGISETSLHLGSTGKLSGNGTIANAVLNAGTITANGGRLDITGTITGTGALQIAGNATLEIGNASPATETITFLGNSDTLKLDAPAKFVSPLSGLAAGDVIDLAKIVATGVTASGTLLTVTTASTTDTLTLTAALASTHVTYTGDGSGGTNVEVFGYAASSAHSPEPVAFGNHHVGDIVSTHLTLANTSYAGASEALDASIGGGTGGVTGVTGSFTGLAAGASNGTSLAIGLNTSNAGTQSGSATISLFTDGTGIDGFGKTALASQTVTVTGAVYNYAAGTLASTSIAFGNHHVGDSVTQQALSLTNSAAAGAYSEALDATLSSAGNGITSQGSVSKLAAGSTSTSLSIGENTGIAGATTATLTVGLISDGTGIDGLGTTTLASQNVTVTDAIYNYAAGTLASSTLAFGNHHVGDSLAQQDITVTNSAAAGAYSEALDATLSGSSGNIAASGSFTGLAAGSSNSTSLVVSASSTAAGAIAGTLAVGLVSDGSGIDGLGTTTLASQNVTVTGGIYNYAQGQLGTTTLAFGNHHVGDSIAQQDIAITNSAAAGAYSEALDATISSGSGNIAASGSFTGLAAGSSNNTSLAVSVSSTAAGAIAGTLAVGLVSDGSGIDGLGTTNLASQNVTITGGVYAYASGKIASTAISLGVVHTGSNAAAALTLNNTASANGFSEALDGNWGSTTGAATVAGSLSGLAASASNSTALSIGVNTSASGTYAGTAAVILTSDGSGIDGLGTTTLGTQTITVTGIVDNYAVASFIDQSATYSMTGSSTSKTINLGSIAQSAASVAVTLGAANSATGLADLLQGTIALNGATTGFTNSGFGSFSGLGAGQNEHAQSVTLTTSTAGTFSETIVLSSAGTNASGYNGTLTTETLTITGTVTPLSSTSYTLAAGPGPQTLTGADGGDIFIANAGALNSHLSLTGGAGTNMLQLQGGGYFDIGAPAVLANVPTITAQEGQAAKGTLAATSQTVFMRNSGSETLNVTAGTAATGNTNPETITIYDGTGNDTFMLAAGADQLYLGSGSATVTLGGSANVITAGGGTATINSTAANAAAAILGTTTSSTTLNITSAGTVTLNATDTGLTVKLTAGSKLTLGKLGFITANGSAGTDSITAGGANQTLIGGSGDTLTGVAAGSDIFMGASAGLNGDSLANWASGDMIDITDMANATVKALVFKTGKLTVTDGTHTDVLSIKGVTGTTLAATNFTLATAGDGHGGVLINWHS